MEVQHPQAGQRGQVFVDGDDSVEGEVQPGEHVPVEQEGVEGGAQAGQLGDVVVVEADRAGDEASRLRVHPRTVRVGAGVLALHLCGGEGVKPRPNENNANTGKESTGRVNARQGINELTQVRNLNEFCYFKSS